MSELKKFLIDHPDIASSIISGRIDFSGGDLMRVLSSYERNGFKVHSSVDDEDMTEEEKRKHHEYLAEQALKILYLQMKGR